jgi:hypothetical protein
MNKEGEMKDTEQENMSDEELYRRKLLRRVPFEHNVVDCTTPVLQTREEADIYERHNNPDGITCTLDEFRKYFAKHRKLYSEGAWLMNHSHWFGEPAPQKATFLPKGCHFDETVLEATRLQQCIRDNNLRKITISGDSNANRLYPEMLGFLKERGISCEIERTETFDDKRGYLAVPHLPLASRRGGCPNCLSVTHVCTTATSSEPIMRLEFLGMGKFWDTRLAWPPEMNRTGLDMPESIQSFLLDHYFHHRGFPDLWIIFPPIHYDKPIAISSITNWIDLILEKMDTNFPKSSRFMLLSHIRFCIQSRKDQLFRTENGISRNVALHLANQALFEAFEERLLSKSGQFLGFLDLSHIMCPFACNWNWGAAHMIEEFYGIITKAMFMLLCSK